MDTNSLIQQIDVMSGERFERFICWLLQSKNYKVLRVGTSLFRSKQRRITGGFYQALRDFGADIIAEKEGEKIAVQTKRCKRPVGKEAVKQAVSALKHYRCHKALVISNNCYTKTALKLASRKRIKLWDRDLLFQELREITY